MKTVRKNISVPISLMEKMKQYPHVNWSAVAAAAFAARLKPLERRETKRYDRMGYHVR